MVPVVARAEVAGVSMRRVRVVVHPALQPERPTFDPDAWRCAGGRGAWPGGVQPPSRKSGSENAACRWAGDLRLRAFEAVAVVLEDPFYG